MKSGDFVMWIGRIQGVKGKVKRVYLLIRQIDARRWEVERQSVGQGIIQIAGPGWFLADGELPNGKAKWAPIK